MRRNPQPRFTAALICPKRPEAGQFPPPPPRPVLGELMLISGRMREPNEIRDAGPGPAPATQLHAENELAVLLLAAESGRSWRPVQTEGKGPTVV